ncbi:MAG: 50S ribosomal protein L27 [Patescibacteria group bacterium]
MAHKLAQGSTRNGRDSKAKRLGVKRADGQYVKVGEIIVRQRGTVIHPSTNVRAGKDHTIYAIQSGLVKFNKKRMPNFIGKLQLRTFVSVVPVAAKA